MMLNDSSREDLQYRLHGLSLSLIVMVAMGGKTPYGEFCLPAESCWPSVQEIITFAFSLTGRIVSPFDDLYKHIILMRNTRVTRYPFFIVMPTTNEDVQKSLVFAKTHNIRVTIQSSGNDFIGRSTANGCIQINMGAMKDIDVNLDSTRHSDGEVTVQSGSNWKEIYKVVDGYGRDVLGSSCPSVSPGGFTLGGGHGSNSRSLGLSVDNIIQYEMVTADGDIVKSSSTGTQSTNPNRQVTSISDTDLFWALGGGGGGTFGVVTKFTFKLHQPATQVVKFECESPLRYKDDIIGKDLIKTFTNLIKKLPTTWGGDMTLLGIPHTSETLGVIRFMLNHYGALSDDDKEYLEPLYSICPNHTFTTFDSFWEFQQTLPDDPYNWLYIFNTLMTADDFSDEWLDFVIDHTINPPTNVSVSGCVGTLIGGKVKDVGTEDTAVNPAFRSSDMSLTCFVVWSLETSYLEKKHIHAAVERGVALQKYGGGVYLNEPSADLPNWQDDFWGNNYEKLLEIKRKWDPDNFLKCQYCVGSSAQMIRAGWMICALLTMMAKILI